MGQRFKPIFQDSFQKHYWRKIGLIVCLLIILAGGLSWWFWQRTDRPNVNQYPVLGLKVSQEDGYQDFQKLKKEDVQFVYLKATEGASYKDDYFDSNYSRAVGSGLQVGIYHYFSFNSTPEQQAAQLFKSVGQDSGNLPIMIYLEYYGQYQQKKPATKKTQKAVAQLIALINQHYQKDCLLGGTPAIVNRYRPAKGQYPLWQTTSAAPKAMQTSGFWQYTLASPLPQQDRQATYQLAVFTGTKAQWRQVQKGTF
ncbi:GH25 family lysozyme [Latilactobacillus fuchuensis]|uniref:GH25 family lysozyme n=1 Tax=Latilactobacillus fuchuensis TaxID=164393 RepID=UPI0020C790DB|nr:GH25 family lysozyme [Latilactobacillus fuchuensis]MCP8856761.1 glycosyl hydrolase [Latilactobacillus fuchuensis]